MKVDHDNDSVTLSTGTEFYAHWGVIGISKDPELVSLYGTTWSLSEGGDGGIEWEEFTPMEKREIADYMASLWEEWGGKKRGWLSRIFGGF